MIAPNLSAIFPEGGVLKPAILALADGSIWHGYSVGIEGKTTVGEVVFNTAMSGYQEIITDPSYAEQMITFSYPHIGNVGCNTEDHEATNVYATGIIVRDLCTYPSNWRQQQSLSEFLIAHKVVAIAGLDTRALVKKITAEGAQHGCIMTGDIDPKEAIASAKAFSGLQGVDLAVQVTTDSVYEWTSGQWQLGQGYTEYSSDPDGFHIVVYDFGAKQSILRHLCDRQCRVTVVPAKTPVAELMELQPDGVLLSNGPGDPAACDYAILAAKQLMERGVPVFGICLGHQILALACDLQTEKMKFGHHGANHPVQEIATKKVFITSQNHGFTVSDNAMADTIEITHRSLFDGSVQGFKHTHLPVMGVQGHPEAGPGPHDFHTVFDDFIALVHQSKRVMPDACVDAVVNE